MTTRRRPRGDESSPSIIGAFYALYDALGSPRTFALIRAQFAWIRGCAFRDDPTARRGSISPVHSRLCFSRRSNGPARIHFPGGSSQPSSQPRTTRTLWVFRSSASGMHACPSWATPSSSTSDTPRVARRGFSTTISYRAERCRKTRLKPGHVRGMQGSIESRPARTLNPRIHSRPARYIHPAEPVYHVHPPRPACGGWEYTSAATDRKSVV